MGVPLLTKTVSSTVVVELYTVLPKDAVIAPIIIKQVMSQVDDEKIDRLEATLLVLVNGNAAEYDPTMWLASDKS
jgi:hypothetical protein